MISFLRRVERRQSSRRQAPCRRRRACRTLRRKHLRRTTWHGPARSMPSPPCLPHLARRRARRGGAPGSGCGAPRCRRAPAPPGCCPAAATTVNVRTQEAIQVNLDGSTPRLLPGRRHNQSRRLSLSTPATPMLYSARAPGLRPRPGARMPAPPPQRKPRIRVASTSLPPPHPCRVHILAAL